MLLRSKFWVLASRSNPQLLKNINFSEAVDFKKIIEYEKLKMSLKKRVVYTR